MIPELFNSNNLILIFKTNNMSSPFSRTSVFSGGCIYFPFLTDWSPVLFLVSSLPFTLHEKRNRSRREETRNILELEGCKRSPESTHYEKRHFVGSEIIDKRRSRRHVRLIHWTCSSVSPHGCLSVPLRNKNEPKKGSCGLPEGLLLSK